MLSSSTLWRTGKDTKLFHTVEDRIRILKDTNLFHTVEDR
jgi:hypothetical protein